MAPGPHGHVAGEFAIGHLVVGVRVVGGDLHCSGEGDRQVVVRRSVGNVLATVGGVSVGYPVAEITLRRRARVGEEIVEAEFERRLDFSVEIDADRAHRLCGPDARHGAGPIHVEHDVLGAVTHGLFAKEVGSVGVAEPSGLVWRDRGPVVAARHARSVRQRIRAGEGVERQPFGEQRLVAHSGSGRCDRCRRVLDVGVGGAMARVVAAGAAGGNEENGRQSAVRHDVQSRFTREALE